LRAASVTLTRPGSIATTVLKSNSSILSSQCGRIRKQIRPPLHAPTPALEEA
jgi:hypothetical protein